jgi:hypothetical protein
MTTSINVILLNSKLSKNRSLHYFGESYRIYWDKGLNNVFPVIIICSRIRMNLPESHSADEATTNKITTRNIFYKVFRNISVDNSVLHSAIYIIVSLLRVTFPNCFLYATTDIFRNSLKSLLICHCVFLYNAEP